MPDFPCAECRGSGIAYCCDKAGEYQLEAEADQLSVEYDADCAAALDESTGR